MLWNQVKEKKKILEHQQNLIFYQLFTTSLEKGILEKICEENKIESLPEPFIET